MKIKTAKSVTKSSFIKENSKIGYKGVNNAYDLNRSGHYCSSKNTFTCKTASVQSLKK